MSLKNVKSSLEKISTSLASTQDSREFLIKNTRDVIILCGQAIILVHKGDLKQAKIHLKNADQLIAKYRKKAKGELNRYLIIPEQELVEAHALISIAEKKEIPSILELKVSEEAYVLGLLDCVGELKRLIYDKIRTGKTNDAEKIFDIMENLFNLLYPMAMYDKIVKETRRKIDVNRILVEDVRAALTEEIRRDELLKQFKKISK